MKKKNLKLNFNKQTIANLESAEQNLIKGANSASHCTLCSNEYCFSKNPPCPVKETLKTICLACEQ